MIRGTKCTTFNEELGRWQKNIYLKSNKNLCFFFGHRGQRWWDITIFWSDISLDVFGKSFKIHWIYCSSIRTKYCIVFRFCKQAITSLTLIEMFASACKNRWHLLGWLPDYISLVTMLLPWGKWCLIRNLISYHKYVSIFWPDLSITWF